MSDAAASTDVCRLLVVDDHEMVAEVLTRVLESEDDLEVVGRAATVAEACRAARNLRPDLVVMDYRLPDGTGAEAARIIRSEIPDVHVVMLTGHADRGALGEALEAGCSGFVEKEGRFDELVEGIRRVVAGRLCISPSLLETSAARSRRPLAIELTVREQEVLDLLSQGRSTNEIVSELKLSIHTVRNHVRKLLAKLGARSRLEAVAVARHRDLLGPKAARAVSLERYR